MSRMAYVALQQFCDTDPGPRQLLLDAGFEVRESALGRRPTREELLEALREADAVLAGVEPYDAALLEVLPRLRCISRCGVGTDAIDVEAARRRGITLCTTPDEVIEPVAQMTVAMILSLARNLPYHLTDAHAGVWKKRTGALLSEWTIGLVGFGKIGRAVARYLGVFSPRVLATDPRAGPGDVPGAVELRSLRSLLTEADVVSLHVNRPRDAGILMGRREFASMKRGSRLVNTARGYLVDEEALYDALRSGHLAGAALDVFEAEPYTGPLAALPQMLCTPHIASLTKASRAAMEWRCARNVVACFSTSPEVALGQGRRP